MPRRLSRRQFDHPHHQPDRAHGQIAGGQRVGHGMHGIRLPLRLLLAFALLALVTLVLPSAPALADPAGAAHPSAALHAYPVTTDPAAHALLQAPPSGVIITFSEDLNPATSRIIVVDPTNREVDNRDSQVSSTNARELSVTLPLLPAGTYIVTWKVQSADDGHVTSGSYYFQIARPDGTAPPLPKTLPTGNQLGGNTSAAGVILDGPTLLQAIATWLALLFMTFWVGGIFWETWILPPDFRQDRPDLDPDLSAAANLAAARFRHLAAPALALLLLSNVLIVLAQSAALAGDWSGLFAPQFLRAILFGSHYGLFWWGRELTALASLILLVVASQQGWAWTRGRTAAGTNGNAAAAKDVHRDGATDSIDAHATPAAIPDWRRELLATLGGIRSLPRQFARGWRHRSGIGQIELVLAVLLLLAFALSGHAAAVPSTIYFPAISVDLLHLLGDAAWLGGLFYIGVVLVPALVALPLRRRARFLALGLPRFGALAILSAVVLAATGSLNATIRMTSFAQLFTTAYGRTLAIKIELFLLMVAISAYHAFWLRPRLAQALATTTAAPAETVAAADTATEADSASETAAHTEAQSALVAASTAHSPTTVVPETAEIPARGASDGHAERDPAEHDPSDQPREAPTPGGSATPTDDPEKNDPKQARVRLLSERLAAWLRREALIGVAILICVALLGAYAGTLAPAPAGPRVSATEGGAYVSQPQTAGPYRVVLKVTPATFGPNTFIVTLADANRNPVSNATVLVQTMSLDMDMGTQSFDLQAMPGAPGSYKGQSDVTMGGNWGVLVKVLAPGASDYVSASFKFVATYGS